MTESVNNISDSLKQFELVDYAVFGFMLIVCLVIGLYFGYKDHNKNKASGSAGTVDYLLGGKNVQVFPGSSCKVQQSTNSKTNSFAVAMSLVASFVSAITLLGTSTEIYLYGTQYAYILAGPFLMGIFMHFVVIPVFYDLKVVSMFEVSF